MGDNVTVHARDRGAQTWWKSFTTGKSAKTLGGVPHDTYGMTSLSIRQYVLGIYKQLGLREKDITKVQTGGPGEFLFIITLKSLIHFDQQTAISARVCSSLQLPLSTTDSHGTQMRFC